MMEEQISRRKQKDRECDPVGLRSYWFEKRKGFIRTGKRDAERLLEGRMKAIGASITNPRGPRWRRLD
jgi:hypothetical protein